MPLPFDKIACVDFETFWSSEYTLSKLPTTDYIWDERFEAQTCAVTMLAPDGAPLVEEADVAAGHADIAAMLGEIDWSRTGFLAHHTQFDGLIATHHFGVYPAFWLDTMSMARGVFGVHDRVSFAAVSAKLGMKGKVHSIALSDSQGKRLSEMTDQQIINLAEYNADDSYDTGVIFRKLRAFVPDSELRLIDITMRMYTEPTLLIDGERVARVYEQERARKQEMYDKLGIDVGSLRKNSVFTAQLEALGIDPPKKVSLKQKDKDGKPKIIPAYAKDDYEFKNLLVHEDDRVRWLVEGRLSSMSNLVETRSAAILKRAGRPTPIYLNYYGAHTGRWSGGDGVNWQNLPKRGLGGELRKSLVAPEGHVLIIADAAQIEARTIFWHAGQHDMVEAFARGNDVYAIAATNTYGYEINKDDNPEERFVGKVLILSGIYGAGAPKINYTFKVGKNGPPLHQTMEQTEEALSGWRAANKYLVRHWYEQKKRATTAFMNLTDVDDGVVCFEGTKRGGYVHLPNGMYIFYPKVYWDEDTQGMAYNGRNGTVNMWHGLIAENVNQAIARVALGEQMVTMEDELRDIRFASTTHDEVIIVAPIKKAEHYAEIVHRIMSTPPAWAEGLPLNADVHISEIYDKT